jgi:hypothetical protein
MIADTYNTKTKRPEATGTTITFPPVLPRPKANILKLKPNYSLLADSTGLTPGNWTLAPQGKGTPPSGYEYSLASSEWKPFPLDGIDVLPVGSAKEKYLVRSAPVAESNTYIPASKTFKVSPLVQSKATKFKADYKKEIIKLKAGTNVFASDTLYTAKTSESFSITNILDTTIGGNIQTIRMWTSATDKKPASALQEYKLAVRANLEPQMIVAESGKVNWPSTLEVFINSKWGKLSKVTQSVTLEKAVRVRATARGTGLDDSSQFAASKAVDLTIKV